MIRTFITPDSKNINISIPKEYIGQELEVILFATKETKKVKPKKVATLADLDGKLSLTPEEADEWNAEIRKSRGHLI